ncbi:MAG: PQQ-dependent sugar dehydrogenase [Actinobacteria bacterium]|nr:PQQ-dependent sugar dehydrogenase [Actinomycetota bacterium]
MKRMVGILLVCLAALAAASGAQAASLQSLGSFNRPIFLTSDPGNPNRLFVVQRAGQILQLENGTVTEFADLRSLVSCCQGEQGLLSIALAPDFDSSGRFFVDYTGREAEPEIHVAELRANGATALGSPVRNLLTIPHPNQTNHYGGQLQFGPEGMLFISTGDGGGSNDQEHNAQNLNSLLGKILRIGVEPSGALPFTVPPGNPFAARPNLNERLVFAYGLRNPYRFSFDRLSHDLVIADVGQSAREEIDWAPYASGLGAGADYGWNCREGRIAGPAGDPQCATPPPGGFVEPVFDYPHLNPGNGGAWGSAIIGGYVSRDPSTPELSGRYVYGDYGTGQIRSLVLSEASASDRSEGLHVNELVGFGEDACGRLYALSGGEGNGAVYRLVGANPNPCTPPPAAAPLAPSSVGIRAVTRRVRRNGRAQLTVWVSPCAGRRGEPVRLMRGNVRLGNRRLDRACTARFLPRVTHRVKFRAEIRADATYEAATSRQLGIRVYRSKKGKKNPLGARLHIPAGVGRR